MEFRNIINEILLPLKLIIPQPIIKRIPVLTTNEEIRINNVLKYIPADVNCLDIGCGNNLLIKKHRQRGGKGVGVDVYNWEGVDLIVKDSSKLPFKNSSFECITYVASLNHIPNRRKALEESYRILKDDGIVIVTFLGPAISRFWHKIIYWDKDQNERGMKKGEIYGFRYEEMNSLLEVSGFRIIKKTKFSLGLNNLYICMKK